jgi:hypothetical protein
LVQEQATPEKTPVSLLERARGNDAAAWHRLVALYRPLVHRWITREGLRAENAEDVAQEVLAAAATGLKDFRRDRQRHPQPGCVRHHVVGLTDCPGAAQTDNNSGEAEGAPMADELEDNWWPDEDYVPYLEAEQRMYAWVLVKVADVEPAEAMQRAIIRFHYEPMSERGLMTHAGAWRIAMCDLFGDYYHDPADFGLETEYEAECRRLFHDE